MTNLLLEATMAADCSPSLGAINKFRPEHAIKPPEPDGVYWADLRLRPLRGHISRWRLTRQQQILFLVHVVAMMMAKSQLLATLPPHFVDIKGIHSRRVRDGPRFVIAKSPGARSTS